MSIIIFRAAGDSCMFYPSIWTARAAPHNGDKRCFSSPHQGCMCMDAAGPLKWRNGTGRGVRLHTSCANRNASLSAWQTVTRLSGTHLGPRVQPLLTGTSDLWSDKWTLKHFWSGRDCAWKKKKTVGGNSRLSSRGFIWFFVKGIAHPKMKIILC